jgi:adenylate cyclase
VTEERAKRKLSAILSADVKGYSRLMGEDELGTVRTLEAYREMTAGVIRNYSGRVVDSPGDNVLAEFASIVDAVESAVEIQREIKAKNAELPENRKMEFRIGINLGDVIEEGERIYGDGVNIAARIEGLADGGGICISGTAFDHIGKRLSVGYEYLGEQTVKNIEEPVRVYRVLMEPEAAGKVIGEKGTRQRKRRWAAIGAIILLIIMAGAVTIWNHYLRLPSLDISTKGEGAFELPKGPSIAVLPFVNMSGDPEQEYFSDGLTENIITSLSASRKLFVIARNSTFTYKGKPVKVQRVARELGVQYVLEGSVQRSKDRVRISVQLIDANTGRHLWAEKYDRDLKDIFALQDDITIKTRIALAVKLTAGEQARDLVGTRNLEALLKVFKAITYLYLMNREGNALARQEVEKAIALDPEYSAAYSLLAMTHIMDLWIGSSKSPLISFAQATKSVKRAIALDNAIPTPYMALSSLYLMRRQHEKAIEAAERAIFLNPNGADAYANLGFILAWSEKPREAIEFLKKAILLNPLPPASYYHSLGIAYRESGQFEEAISAHKKALDREPSFLYAHTGLTAAYMLMGREEEARAEASQVLKKDPKFSLEYAEKIVPYRNQADAERFIDALRKAGLN